MHAVDVEGVGAVVVITSVLGEPVFLPTSAGRRDEDVHQAGRSPDQRQTVQHRGRDMTDEHPRPARGGGCDDGQPVPFLDPQRGPAAGLDVGTSADADQLAASAGVAQPRVVEPESREVATQEETGG
ncbi:hypothetical protein ASE87_11495 [Frigoribacterium sp. Leaf44]|nr:hypothetical protein ASE87_11495 [Frigoribacterium sp. Leaf44]